MSETPRRRRADKWAVMLIPLAITLILGGYGYTYRETGKIKEQIQTRLSKIDDQQTRILCKLDPEECLRGGPR